MTTDNDLIEGTHFYYNDSGYTVFTEKYLLQRGYCCGNGCKHCPYFHENVPDIAKKINCLSLSVKFLL